MKGQGSVLFYLTILRTGDMSPRSSGLAETILQGTVTGGRRQDRQKVLGRQRKGMDRPAFRKVPEGSGEQRKMEETICEVTCGAPTTPTPPPHPHPAVKG